MNWLQVPRCDEGLEAIIFTAQGDMRQALNNLQSTYAGFGFVSAENVFKVTMAIIDGSTSGNKVTFIPPCMYL